MTLGVYRASYVSLGAKGKGFTSSLSPPVSQARWLQHSAARNNAGTVILPRFRTTADTGGVSGDGGGVAGGGGGGGGNAAVAGSGGPPLPVLRGVHRRWLPGRSIRPPRRAAPEPGDDRSVDGGGRCSRRSVHASSRFPFPRDRHPTPPHEIGISLPVDIGIGSRRPLGGLTGVGSEMVADGDMKDGGGGGGEGGGGSFRAAAGTLA